MANYVLVHGEWYGAWGWDRIVGYLESADAKWGVEDVITVDLPGHGKRRAGDIRRITMNSYVEAVVTPIQVKRLTNVTLVCYSFAATFADLIVAQLGHIVDRIVFIAGRLPSQGSRVYDSLPTLERVLIRIFKPEEKGIKYPNFMMRRMLCNDMNEHDTEDILARLVSDPYLPWMVSVERAGFPNNIAKTYVILTRDKVVPVKLQRRYAESLEAVSIVEIDAGHEAILTHPKEIGDFLLAESPGKNPKAPAGVAGE